MSRPSIDAKIHHWQLNNYNLTLAQSFSTPGPAEKLRTFNGGWVASVATRKLFVHFFDNRPQIELVLERPITDIAVDKEGHLLAVAAANNITIFNSSRNTIATAFQPGADIGCVQFVTGGTLAACDKAAIIFLNLNSLTYFPISSIQQTQEKSIP